MNTGQSEATQALKVTSELLLKSISWKGVRLEPSNEVQLRICLLGHHAETKRQPARLPLRIAERIIFERTFPLCVQPIHVFSSLDNDQFALDLIEYSGSDVTVIAMFRSSVNELLFRDPPQIQINEKQTHFYDFVLDNSSQFQKYSQPNLSLTVKTVLSRVQDPLQESNKDGAFNLTRGTAGKDQHQPGKYSFSPFRKSRVTTHLSKQDIPRRLCQRIIIRSIPERREVSSKRPFVVRHVDDKLIGRVPGSGNELAFIEQTTDHGSFHPKDPASRAFSTSQRETVASILRRRPKIERSVFQYQQEGFFDNWCQDKQVLSKDRTFSERRKIRASTINRKTRNNSEVNKDTERTNSESEISDDEKHLSCTCCEKHHHETCTICKLYRQYFGKSYPIHEARCMEKN